MVAVEKEELDSADVRFSDRSACCVIAASDGYPSHYEKGFKISIPEDPEGEIFVAGATLEGNDLLTSGGRVLGYTAVAPTLEEAINSAYNGISKVHFDNMYYRHDIGSGALSALKN